IAQKLRASNLQFAAFHIEFDSLDSPEIRDRLRASARLARILAVPVLTVPASPADVDLQSETLRLTEWSSITEREGVILPCETQAGTLTKDPAKAEELCRNVPGLGITLDPSWSICGKEPPINYDRLFPFVRHVRLRDSGSPCEQFQVRVGQGG